MNKGRKYYVVWVGAEPGIYDSWTECQLQIKSYPGARYKSYPDKESAVRAYRGDPAEELGLVAAIARRMASDKASGRSALPPKIESTDGAVVRDYSAIPGIRLDAVAVDGACSGNPGDMEYRAVRVADGVELFRRGKAQGLVGTNNIAEYLALIHIAAMLASRGDYTRPIYTDSRTALSWLKRGHSKTTLERTPRTAATLDLLERADAWLAHNTIRNPILKWDTDHWGEIPADFGRK